MADDDMEPWEEALAEPEDGSEADQPEHPNLRGHVVTPEDARRARRLPASPQALRVKVAELLDVELEAAKAHGASAAKLTSLANLSKVVLEAYSVERLVREGEQLSRRVQAQEARDKTRHADIAALKPTPAKPGAKAH